MSDLKPIYLPGLVLIAVALLFLRVVPAYAQTILVAAAPEPNQSVSSSPSEVRLTFDHPLLDQGTSLSVTNQAGGRVDNQDSRVDPNDRFELVVTLPDLPEGQYTVTYVVANVGSSTALAGDYQFTINFPDPVVKLVTPHGGQIFEAGPIPIELQTQYIDFSDGDNSIRIYVDGALYMEMRDLKGQITDLSPGVHEIRLALVGSGGQEVPETSSTQYIVIANPDPEMAGRAAAAVAPADPGLQLTLPQWLGIILATLILLGIGWWLGGKRM